MIDKVKILKELEYQVKLFRLRLKYSKNVFDTMFISMQLGMTINQIRIVMSQPKPKFPSGMAIVGSGNRAEVMIDKNGKQYKL